MWEPSGELAELIREQDGAVSRAQLLAAGLTRSEALQPIRAGRWQTLFPGAYATFDGPVPERTRVFAALLAVGREAVAGFRTALWLAGFLHHPPGVIQICIPWSRRVVAPTGVEVVQRRGFESLVQSSNPPRTRFDVSVMDVVERAERADAAVGLVLESVQRRFTSAERLRQELARRGRHRWRKLLAQVLDDAADGVASALERRYVAAVERRHGLPTGLRNAARTDADGRRRYDDVAYRDFDVVVELDGRTAHPVPVAFRDWRRDNASTVEGKVVLRYGWTDVDAHSCEVAAQVATMLGRGGWTGRLRRCPNCPPT